LRTLRTIAAIAVLGLLVGTAPATRSRAAPAITIRFDLTDPAGWGLTPGGSWRVFMGRCQYVQANGTLVNLQPNMPPSVAALFQLCSL
jgi:hypothetical protein